MFKKSFAVLPRRINFGVKLFLHDYSRRNNKLLTPKIGSSGYPNILMQLSS